MLNYNKNQKIVNIFKILFLFYIIIHNSYFADSFTLELGDSKGSLFGKMIQLSAVMVLLTLAPSIVVMLTSFTRIVIVFSFLRNALGTQQSPPNMILISLSLFLSLYIMSPFFNKSYEDGIKPLMEETISYEVAFDKSTQPFKTFMLKNVRPKDLELFLSFEKKKIKSPKELSLKTLIPAFIISEIRRGFEMGFLIYLPFVVIDMVIASVLMSMGMMMLPPTLIAMPFKIIFFVLIDGWNLLCSSLIKSFS